MKVLCRDFWIIWVLGMSV